MPNTEPHEAEAVIRAVSENLDPVNRSMRGQLCPSSLSFFPPRGPRLRRGCGFIRLRKSVDQYPFIQKEKEIEEEKKGGKRKKKINTNS